MTAIILGNGPSKNKGLEARAVTPLAVVYACNLVGITDKPDYLYAVDPWVQFDIVSNGYKGACKFLDFDPIPAELPIEDILYDVVPKDYDIKIHNPEHRDEAVGWIFYCTGDTMNHFWNDMMRYDTDYWRPRRAYILYVPAGLNITTMEDMGIEREQHGPSGAYALQGAIEDGHTEIDVYGFDSIAGEYATESRVDLHDKKEEMRRGEHFMKYYDKIMNTYPEVNITWCT